MWLEFVIIYGWNKDSDFEFAYRGRKDEASIRRKASDIMKSVLTDDEFEVILDESKGTYSMQNFATDRAKKGGFTKMILIYGFNCYKNKCKIIMLLLLFHLLMESLLVRYARMELFIII